MLDDETRHLTTSLHFTLSKADIFVWLMMNISSFSCSGSGFSRLSNFECFLFFQLIAQFYSSSLKLPNHHYLLSNTMRIWVSFFEIFNWGVGVILFFKIGFWVLREVLAHFLEYCLVICGLLLFLWRNFNSSCKVSYSIASHLKDIFIFTISCNDLQWSDALTLLW